MDDIMRSEMNANANTSWQDKVRSNIQEQQEAKRKAGPSPFSKIQRDPEYSVVLDPRYKDAPTPPSKWSTDPAQRTIEMRKAYEDQVKRQAYMQQQTKRFQQNQRPMTGAQQPQKQVNNFQDIFRETRNRNFLYNIPAEYLNAMQPVDSTTGNIAKRWGLNPYDMDLRDSHPAIESFVNSQSNQNDPIWMRPVRPEEWMYDENAQDEYTWDRDRWDLYHNGIMSDMVLRKTDERMDPQYLNDIYEWQKKAWFAGVDPQWIPYVHDKQSLNSWANYRPYAEYNLTPYQAYQLELANRFGSAARAGVDFVDSTLKLPVVIPSMIADAATTLWYGPQAASSYVNRNKAGLSQVNENWSRSQMNNPWQQAVDFTYGWWDKPVQNFKQNYLQPVLKTPQEIAEMERDAQNRYIPMYLARDLALFGGGDVGLTDVNAFTAAGRQGWRSLATKEALKNSWLPLTFSASSYRDKDGAPWVLNRIADGISSGYDMTPWGKRDIEWWRKNEPYRFPDIRAERRKTAEEVVANMRNMINQKLAENPNIPAEKTDGWLRMLQDAQNELDRINWYEQQQP